MMMRAVIQASILTALSVTLASAQGQPTSRTVISAGGSRANLEIAASAAVEVAAAPVVCQAATPNECPALPEITGFADTSKAFNADEMNGRVLIVRNTGDGVLVLKNQATTSTAQWWMSERRVLRAGESVALVYDGPQVRWKPVGAQQ
jgi:hypothetical protein